MTLRISEPNLWNTEVLLGQVLVPIFGDAGRVAFLCDPGTGKSIVQRMRMMMSRKRKNLRVNGRKVKQFRLHCSVHPETHEGKRHDCVVLWKSISETHLMSEDLEDVLCNG